MYAIRSYYDPFFPTVYFNIYEAVTGDGQLILGDLISFSYNFV